MTKRKKYQQLLFLGVLSPRSNTNSDNHGLVPLWKQGLPISASLWQTLRSLPLCSWHRMHRLRPVIKNSSISGFALTMNPCEGSQHCEDPGLDVIAGTGWPHPLATYMSPSKTGSSSLRSEVVTSSASPLPRPADRRLSCEAHAQGGPGTRPTSGAQAAKC